MGEIEHTLGFRRKIAHTGLHVETGGVLDGDGITSARSPTSPGRVSERQTLPLLGLGRVCSRKTQKAFGTAMRMMRVAVPRRRGPAGLRDLFTFVEVAACTPCAQGLSACAKEGWYHYPRCAPRAAETPDGRLSKRLICSFLVFPIYICERPRRVMPISALIQIDCCWISCGLIACPWLIQA